MVLIGEFSPVGNRKREDMGMDKNDSLGMCIAKIIGCVILICLIASFSRSCSRSDRNMVSIKEGYCCDYDTQIIYIESYTGRYGLETIYTPYYNSDGDLCKYDLESGNWIPIE